MKLEELIETALNRRQLSKEICEEILSYGISEFLESGCTYHQAITIIERAEIGKQRSVYQSQYTPEQDDEA